MATLIENLTAALEENRQRLALMRENGIKSMRDGLQIRRILLITRKTA